MLHHNKKGGKTGILAQQKGGDLDQIFFLLVRCMRGTAWQLNHFIVLTLYQTQPNKLNYYPQRLITNSTLTPDN